MDPKELHDVVKSLSAALKTVNKADLSSPRKSAILYLIADANRLGLAIALLVDGNNRGVPVGAHSIEVLTRTLIEDAILASYIGQMPDDQVALTLQNTVDAQLSRSLNKNIGKPGRPQLPPHRNMALAAAPELEPVWSELSYLSHPSYSFAYSHKEASLGRPVSQGFFQMRLAKVVQWLDQGVTHLVRAHRAAAQ